MKKNNFIKISIIFCMIFSITFTIFGYSGNPDIILSLSSEKNENVDLYKKYNPDNPSITQNTHPTTLSFSIQSHDSILFGHSEILRRNTDPFIAFGNGGIAVGYLNEEGSLPITFDAGMNNNGLIFQIDPLPGIFIGEPTSLEKWDEGQPYQALYNADTTQEVKSWMEDRFMNLWGGYSYGQIHFSDPFGDFSVMSINESNEFIFTNPAEHENFLVSTNFNLAYPENHYNEYPDPRYDSCLEFLSTLDSSDEFFGAISNYIQNYTNVMDRLDYISYIFDPINMKTYIFTPNIQYIVNYHEFDYLMEIEGLAQPEVRIYKINSLGLDNENFILDTSPDSNKTWNPEMFLKIVLILSIIGVSCIIGLILLRKIQKKE